MATVAKFFVSEIARYGGGTKVKLTVVSRGEDNKSWASATPSGTIEMTILNKLAVEQFELGREFLVKFEPQVKPKEAICNHWQGYWNAETGAAMGGPCSLCGYDKDAHTG